MSAELRHWLFEISSPVFRMDVLHTIVAYFGFQSAHSFDYSSVPSKQFIDVVPEPIELRRRGRSEEAGV